MRKICLILSSIIIFNCTFAQDKILYFVPDAVELKLEGLLEKKKGEKLSVFLMKDKDDYALYLSFVKKDEEYNDYWVDRTNRYIVIGEKEYPLIFDYDLTFSTPNPKSAGSLGNREGNILKIAIIYEGYYVKFNSIEIIETNIP